jgi:hypothetical protein
MDGFMPIWLLAVIACAGASVAAVTGVIGYRVRNVLTFPLIAAGLAYQAALAGGAGLWAGLLGVLCGVAVLTVPWR